MDSPSQHTQFCANFLTYQQTYIYFPTGCFRYLSNIRLLIMHLIKLSKNLIYMTVPHHRSKDLGLIVTTNSWKAYNNLAQFCFRLFWKCHLQSLWKFHQTCYGTFEEKMQFMILVLIFYWLSNLWARLHIVQVISVLFS